MISASYTAGGMTITASMSDATDRNGGTLQRLKIMKDGHLVLHLHSNLV